jgi:hypothetical protein
MWNRACPLCFAKVPRSLILTCGEKLACPCCRAPLELSRASRVLGATCGLLAGCFAVHLILNVNLTGTWILQVIAAVLAYGLASTAALYSFSDLVVQANPLSVHFPHPRQ